MLELAAKLSTNRILVRRSILFVAFGASRETFAGAWYFLNRSFSDADHIDAMVNLDMVGTGDRGFYAYTSSNEDMNRIVRSLQGELLPVNAELATEEPYPSDHEVFYEKEIPSVFSRRGVIRNTRPDVTPRRSSIMREWNANWNMSTVSVSSLRTGRVRCSGPT